jgi:hypothetical protein
LNYDTSISNDPLITIYPSEKFTVEKKYGQIVYVDFEDELEDHYKLITSTTSIRAKNGMEARRHSNPIHGRYHVTLP